jgi:hypothetical protein
MVNELLEKDGEVYACGLRGHGYANLETVERCKQYCYTHCHPSPELTKGAVRKISWDLLA